MITHVALAEVQLRPTVCEAVEKVAAEIDDTGIRALRILLHAGMSAYWPLVEAAPAEQVRAYADMMAMVTKHCENCASGHTETAAVDPFRVMDAEVIDFLELCAQRSGTQWLEPINAVAAYVVSVLYGAVLRWLVDRDAETILVVLDDLVGTLVTKAGQE